ncbi:MAG TPA: GNAT family N-acetyltransferase [Geminicoccus sp.]|uniref:GNAT family N-acetyltransferase n=1 Tax=Geminicoccus sp. TaxID=2024832 RepID=UPI002E373EE2|nr:GNAT family N-acetyltransferase [Geminicoccus sp.]HEX2525805.1 GNAT family N-acetyltransferase [Geminicoccus sp.]
MDRDGHQLVVRIRGYRAEDASPLSGLYVQSVEQLGCRDYSAEQVAAWVSLAPSPERLHDLIRDGRVRLVAADGSDRPVAFADLKSDGHIHFFYCLPEAAGQGVASALYDKVERFARDRALNSLYAEASEAACRFFLKKGFTVLSKRQFDVAGVPIHNYAVEKTLGR